MSNKEMWFDELDDLSSEIKGTRPSTDPRIRLKSSLSSRSILVQELSPNQRIMIHILFKKMECDYPKQVVHILDL